MSAKGNNPAPSVLDGMGTVEEMVDATHKMIRTRHQPDRAVTTGRVTDMVATPAIVAEAFSMMDDLGFDGELADRVRDSLQRIADGMTNGTEHRFALPDSHDPAQFDGELADIVDGPWLLVNDTVADLD